MSGLCLTLRRWMSIGDCFLPPHAGYLVGQCIWSKAPSVGRRGSRTEKPLTHYKNHPLVPFVCGVLTPATCCWLYWHAQDLLNWILWQLICVLRIVLITPIAWSITRISFSVQLQVEPHSGHPRYLANAARSTKDKLAAKFLGWMSDNFINSVVILTQFERAKTF